MTGSNDKPLLDETLADEQQLDEYLKGDSGVSRHYRQLPGTEVPAELDRLVLRQAEDAVKRRHAQGRPAWVRWTAPLAVAASAVLVLSIVIETGVRDETVTLQAPQPAAPVARERAKKEATDAIVSEQVAPASGFAPPAEVASEPSSDEQRAASRERQVMPVAPPPPVAAPAAPPTIAATQSVSRAAEEAARALRASSLEQPARKQSAPVADDVAREEERTAGELAFSRRISAPMPPPPQVDKDPEAWLQSIRELRKANKQEQADQEWRRFRAAFPNYEVAETDTAREAKK